MQNPFVYGEVVPAAAFVDRVAELDRLVARPRRRFVGGEAKATNLLARDREADLDEPGQQHRATRDRAALVAALDGTAVSVLEMDDGRDRTRLDPERAALARARQ